MNATKKKELSLIDFAVLSIIFFGYAIYISTIYFFSTGQGAPLDPGSITAGDHWQSIFTEISLLIMAVGYLYFRRFDVKQLDFSVGRSTLPLTLLLIFAGAIASDIGIYSLYWLFPPEAIPANTVEAAATTGSAGFFGHVSFALIVFALLNGFFEELFFMGITFAVGKRHLLYALAGSLLVRFAFHTYQGIPTAVGITLMGVVFLLVRRKVHSITPFVLAHAFFDVMGASLYYWIYNLL